MIDRILLKFKSDVPFAISVPKRIIPVPLMNAVMECVKGVKGPVSEPTDWCVPLVIVLRRTGKNPFGRRSIPFEQIRGPDVDFTLAQIQNAKVFSKLDASNRFWQIPLARECMYGFNNILNYWKQVGL